MKKYLLWNITAALVFLGVLVAISYLVEWNGRPRLFGYVYQTGIAVYFLLSLALNRRLFQRVANSGLRYAMLVVLCGLVTVVISYLGLVLVVNIHLGRGGGL